MRYSLLKFPKISRVRFKFILAATAILLLLLVGNFLNIYLVKRDQNQFSQMRNRNTQIQELTEKLQYQNQNLLLQLFLYYSYNSPNHVEEIRAVFPRIADIVRRLDSVVQSERDHEMIAEFSLGVKNSKALIDELVAAINRSNITRSKELFKQYLIVHDANLAKIKDIKSLKLIYTTEEIENVNESAVGMTWMSILFSIVFLLAVVFLIFYYELVFLRPLGKMTEKLKHIGKSNFTFEVPAVFQDELGDLNQALSATTQEVKRRIDAEKSLNVKLRLANEELQHFSQIASHDLKEPLRAMKIYADILQEDHSGPLNAEAKDFLSEISASASRLNAMIEGLQALFHIGSWQGTFAELRLEGIVKASTANLRSLIDERHAEINYSFLPSVMGDFAQLVQLFQNLISNGIKYNQSPKPIVQISVEVDADRPSFWRISLKDNGIGFDARFEEKIFRLFARLHSQEVYEGTGIGLALCKKIVNSHGGEIWVSSEEGHGSTFFFTLPRLMEPQGS